MAEIHTYPEMNAQIKDLLRIGEQPICLYAAKRIEELEEYERKNGKNIATDYDEVDQFVCSECGIELQNWVRVERDEDDGDETYHEYRFNFCPNCGADMREKNK